MRVIGNKDQDGKSVITASGTLSNGSVVTINSAGTVSIVSDTNRSLGDSVDPSGSGSAPSYTSVTYDPDTDRYILFYTDGGNNSYGTAVVGQVNGTTITFGTPVAYISAVTYYNSCDYDTNQNKVVNAYANQGSNGWGYVITGTVNASNNSIVFATPVAFENASATTQASHIYLHFVSGQNKIVIGYKEVTSNSYDGWGIAGEVQANGSVTFGTRQQFLNNTGSDLYLAVNSEGNRIIFAYGYANTGVVKCAELSGTNLTMNSSHVQFDTYLVSHIDITFDSNRDRHIIAYRHNQNGYGRVISTNGLTGSGSSVTTTFPVSSSNFNEATTDQIRISYNPDVRRFFVSYRDSSNNLQVRQGALWIFSSAPVIKLDHNNSTGGYDNIQIQTAGDDYTSNYGGGKICTLYRSSNESSAVRSRILQPEDKKIFPSPQQIISSTTGTMLAVIYDTTNKRLVYAYRGNTGAEAVVATHVGGTSGITSVGTPVQWTSNQLAYPSMCFHPVENRVVICYKDNSDSGKLKAVAGAVDPSDNSIQFGTPIPLSNAASFYSSCCYVPTMNRVFACWRDENNSSKLYGTSINVSDKVCSIASIQNVANVASDYPICCYHPTQDRVVVHYRDSTGNNNYASVVAGGVIRENGAVSFGTPVTVSSSNTDNCGICYDSTHDKLLLTYNEGSSAYGVVGTLSNVSFSFGTRLQYRSTSGSYNQVLHDPDSGKNIVYSSDSNSKIRYNIGTISGTAVSFTESADVTNGFNYFCDYQGGAPSYASGHVYNPDKKATVFCFETSGAGKTSILTIGSTSVTANNTLGFSDGDFADTTNATISTANAIIRNQTGLTAGQTMFVLSNGSISTTAGTPSITAGTAISSTELIVKG